MRAALLSIVLLATAILSACSVNPKPPTVLPPVEPPAIDLSTLEATTSVSYAVIANELNKSFPIELFWTTGHPIENCPVDECTYQVRVLRDSISVNHDGSGGLVVTMPIRTTDGRVDVMKRVLGQPVRMHADLSANITSAVSLSIALQPDWTADPTAQLQFHVNGANVHINIVGIGVDISVRDKLEKILNDRRGDLQRKILEALKGRLDFRSVVAQTWDQLHSVKQLSSTPPVWLVIDPVSIKAENPKALADGLHAAVGIGTYLSAHAQQDAPTAPRPEALPNLKVIQNLAGRYKLSMPIRLSVDEANKQLSALVGKEYIFNASGKTITAKLIDGRIYTNGPDLVVYAKVHASKVLLGIIPIRVGTYLNGKPNYTPSSTTVSLDPLDYDADTNILLIDKAEWFFHGTIREEIKKALQFNIGKDINNIHQLLSNKLSQMQLSNHLVLRGTVDSINPKAVYTTINDINVDVLAEGKLKVEFTAVP